MGRFVSISLALALLCLCCVRDAALLTENELFKVAKEFNAQFDAIYPSPVHLYARERGTNANSASAAMMSSVYSPLQLHHMHGKRCISIEVSASVDHLLRTKKWEQTSVQGLPLLVATPCLGSDSLGNSLGAYFENILCARETGLHFVAASPIWEPETNDAPSAFLREMPTVLFNNRSVASLSGAVDRLRSLCRCPGSCHERKQSLWTRHLDVLRPLLWSGIRSHVRELQNQKINATVVRKSDLSSVPVHTRLPLIPEVAIHYRCGDNFVGHYGFLPFRAFIERIPRSAKTIYVLAEHRDRKTTNKRHRAEKCDAVFSALLQFLSTHFPQAVVLIRRGDDLYTDMARLAMAPVTVCSVSTFCLWPAVMHRGLAFFPQSPLIVEGDTSIDLGFRWISSPPILLGRDHEFTSTQDFLNLLRKDSL